MDKDANLYERKYKGTKQTSQETIDYWKKFIGECGIDYIKNNWPHALEKNYDYTINIVNPQYEELKRYYMTNCIIEDLYIIDHYKNKNLGCFFFDFLTIIYESMQFHTKKCEISFYNEAYLNYLDMVYEKFLLIAARTIILEMSFWNKTNPSNKSAEELYCTYCEKCLMNREYRLKLYDKYPAVLRNVIEVALYAINNFKLFSERIEKDKKDIEKIICNGETFSHIANLKGSLSDSHCGGKSVMRADLSNGKSIIYKQHSIKNEIIYQEIAEWFGEKCGLEMFSYRCLDYTEYGWQEYVFWKPCKSIQDLKKYYGRIGIHLFVCYLLNTSDIHAENLIACGEYPVIVDMETITTPRIDQLTGKQTDKIDSIISQSVLHSGLLPFYIWSKNGTAGVDVSALNGGLNQKIPIKIPVIINPFRIDMKINYRQAIITKKNNFVQLKSKHILPFAFDKIILTMFKKSYLVVSDYRCEIKKMLKKFLGTKVRFVARNSQQYAMLLSASFHPELTEDVYKRHMFFYSLCNMNTKFYDLILEAEIKDLLQGDLPYFYFFIDDINLYDSRNEKIEGFFKEAIQKSLHRRVDFMNERDLEQQCRFIEISLSMMRYGFFKDNSIEFKKNDWVKKMSKEQAIALAERYGDYLLETAVYNEETKDVNWIGIKIKENDKKDWNLCSLNMYFYDGKCGIAFYLHLLKTLKGKKYDKMCEMLDETFFRHTENFLKQNEREEVNTGTFYGEASILYLYEFCYKLYKQEKYMEYCYKQALIIKRYFALDKKYDLLFGNAGAIITILNLYDITGDYEFLSLAIEMGEFLMDHSEEMVLGIGWKSSINPYCLGGMSHGNSGIALAFANLYSRTKEGKYINIIRKILLYENSLYDAVEGNWKDIRGKNSYANTWCHGAAGILLGRTKLYEMLKDTDLKSVILEDIEKATKKVMKQKKLKLNCLCHGNMGNIFILHEYGIRMENQAAIDMSENMFNMMMNEFRLNKLDNILAFERYNPGFMVGATGIYYAILKHYIRTIPNIMLLEI